MTPHEVTLREDHLIAFVERSLPSIKEMCTTAVKNGAVIVFHQDAYAADYQKDEYRLLGMAIKYIGMHGLDIQIHGKNRETLKP